MEAEVTAADRRTTAPASKPVRPSSKPYVPPPSHPEGTERIAKAWNPKRKSGR